MVQSSHDGVNELGGVLLPLLGEVQIDHGRFQIRVAHVPLDGPEVHPRFQQMGGIAVAQGVNRDRALVDAGRNHGLPEGSLHAGGSHRRGGSRRRLMASADRGEEERGVAVGHPVLPEQSQRRLGEGNVAILGPLAAVDVDHQTGAVDVGDLQVQPLLQPESTGVDRGEEGVVVEGADTAQRPADLLDAQDGREFPLPLRPQELEERPVSLQHLLEEEPDPRVADPQGGGGPPAHVPPVQEVRLQGIRRDLVRCLVLELDKHPHGACVCLLGALPLAVQLQGLDHAVVPLGLHVDSPFPDEGRWGTTMVPRESQDSGSSGYTEAEEMKAGRRGWLSRCGPPAA